MTDLMKINSASKVMIIISIALLPMHFWSFSIQHACWHRIPLQPVPQQLVHVHLPPPPRPAPRLPPPPPPPPPPPLEPIRSKQGLPSHYDVFKGFLDRHVELRRSAQHTPPPGFHELEPSEYTDEKTLDYTVSGLRNITVAEEATFEVDTQETITPETRSEYVRILFYGIAVMSPQEWTGDSSGVWQAKFHMQDPGLYRVHIESVYRNRANATHLYRRITGSPFTLLVRPVGTDHLSEAEVVAMMRENATGSSAHQHDSELGSVTFPQALCTDARWRPGRWVRCYHTPEPCVRTGWLWLPEECHFHIYPAEEIQALPKPVWIVIAGSSVQRGTYFAFLDYLVAHGAKNLTNSPFWKCWGWMDLSLRNIRVSYLDFRTPYLYPSDENFNHPNVEKRYLTNALWALHRLGGLDGGGPDVFYLEDNAPSVFLIHMVRSWFGADWDGRFMFHATKGCAGLDVCGDRLHPNLMGVRPEFWRLFEEREGIGAEPVDENRMVIPMMHDQEQPMARGVSQHFHRPCSEGGMYSCSVVCDMAAQQLLNVFLNSPAPYRKPNPQYHNLDGAPRFCLRCPRELVPFTIKTHYDNITCHDHIPIFRDSD